MSRWVSLLDHPDTTSGEPLLYIADVASGTDQCTPATTVRGGSEILGIVTRPGVEVSGVRLIPLDVVRGFDVPIRVAQNAIPRLTIVALPPGGLPVRDYDLILDMTSAQGATRIAQRICVT